MAHACRKLGSISRSCNAAIASRVRSCQRPHCSQRRRIPTTAISTPRCPATSAGAAPMCAFARPSRKQLHPHVLDSRSRERTWTMAVRLGSEPALSRRDMLRVGAAAGGGLLLGFYTPFADAAASAANAAPATGRSFAPDAFIRIDRAGKITLVMPQVEMGQGVYTSLSMILAEELDAAFPMVEVEAAPPSDALYGNPVFGIQATGNSNSVRAFWKKLRLAGAGARAILIEAAASQWKVAPESCAAADGEVIHAPTGQRLAYGALADAAAKLAPPANPPLKDPKNFKLIGKPVKRLDTPDKVDGKALYGIDMLPPGVKFAAIAASPVFGGKVGRVDDT